MADEYIYRVVVRTTGSLQPGKGATYWDRDVVYCGPSLQEARIAYLREEAGDFGGGFGNRYRETLIEKYDAEPVEIDDLTAKEVE